MQSFFVSHINMQYSGCLLWHRLSRHRIPAVFDSLFLSLQFSLLHFWHKNASHRGITQEWVTYVDEYKIKLTLYYERRRVKHYNKLLSSWWIGCFFYRPGLILSRIQFFLSPFTSVLQFYVMSVICCIILQSFFVRDGAEGGQTVSWLWSNGLLLNLQGCNNADDTVALSLLCLLLCKTKASVYLRYCRGLPPENSNWKLWFAE